MTLFDFLLKVSLETSEYNFLRISVPRMVPLFLDSLESGSISSSEIFFKINNLIISPSNQ